MLQKPSDMSNYQFLQYLYENKSEFGLTWDDIAAIMNKYEETAKSGNAYRKMYSRIKNKVDDEYQLSFNLQPENNQDEQNMIKENVGVQKEIQRYKDERTQLNAIYRQYSRELLLKDIAVECADLIAKNNPFSEIDKYTAIKATNRTGILLLSDWHYGITINNHWNKYDPDVCRERVGKLLAQTIRLIDVYGIETLYVLNLGDLISGRIHAQLRIENREDAVSQVIHVSELLAQFLNDLSKHVYVEYYDCLDNHSRVEPNIKESLRLESLARIITWYLKERFYGRNDVSIAFNDYSDDIISFRTENGWNVVGVHGDLDPQKAVIKNMRGMLDERPDLVCTAHLHHFSANEENECVMVSNPCLMGTDGFAESKRLTSRPAQTFIVSDTNSPDYAIHRIVLG